MWSCDHAGKIYLFFLQCQWHVCNSSETEFTVEEILSAPSTKSGEFQRGQTGMSGADQKFR